MASTPVMKKPSRWVARACPELFATLISTFATCWGTVVGLERPTPSLDQTPEQIPINLCRDLGLTAEPCPENGGVQVVRRANFELRWLFCCTSLKGSTCWSISSSEDDVRPSQCNHSQNGPLRERTRPRSGHGRDSDYQCCRQLQVCLWLRHSHSGRHSHPQGKICNR